MMIFNSVKLFLLMLCVGKLNSAAPCAPSDTRCQRLQIIQEKILRKLGITRTPTINCTISKAVREQFKLTNDGPFPESSGKTICETKIKTQKTYNYSAEKPNRSNSQANVLQFSLDKPENDEFLVTSDDIKVTNVNLSILLRWKNKNKRGRRANKKKHNRKVDLRIYRIDGPLDKEEQVATSDVILRHTKWHTIPIPTWVVQEAYNQTEKILQLKVVCTNCDQQGPKITLFKNKGIEKTVRKSKQNKRETKGKRKTKRRPKRKKLNKRRRPLLRVRTTQTLASLK